MEPMDSRIEKKLNKPITQHQGGLIRSVEKTGTQAAKGWRRELSSEEYRVGHSEEVTIRGPE